MNCDGIREVTYEYLKGWCEPSRASAIQSHLATCAGCAEEVRKTQSALSLLKTLPEIEASPETWENLRRSLPGRKPVPGRAWARAVAAGFLVAVLSLGILASMPRSRALPVVVETDKALSWNDPFHAERFTTIKIPDVATLKLDQNTTLRLPDPRTCILESGELFADVLPTGKGFEIRSSGTTVTVHGTRFGVAAPATVYVVEGRVEVRSSAGRRDLGPGQVVVGERLFASGAEDRLHWLAQHERPSVRLRLDPRNQTTITPGSPFRWHLILETDSPVPLYLGAPRDISQYLYLRLNKASVSLDPSAISILRASSAPNGLVRCDVSHPCVLECAIDPGLFREKGPASVSAIFTSGTNAPEKAWVGIVESEPVRVEVR
jgi:ferric-dicitrate binding protein FerR (iron transport regulator)